MKKVGSLVVLLACALSACVAPAMDDEAFDESAAVGEAEQALGEAGCGTVTPDAFLPGWNSSVTSPATYGSTQCPDQYVAEFGSRQTNLGMGPSAMPVTETACVLFHYEEGHYTQQKITLPTGLSVWGFPQLIAEVKYSGTWMPATGPDTIHPVPYCYMQLDSGSDSPPNPPPVPNSTLRYRIAGRAYRMVLVYRDGMFMFERHTEPVDAWNVSVH